MNGKRPRLILASASPRRRQLLSEAGYDFEVVTPAVEELHSREAHRSRSHILQRAPQRVGGRAGAARRRSCSRPTRSSRSTSIDRQTHGPGRCGASAAPAQRPRSRGGLGRFHRPSAIPAKSIAFSVLSRVVFKKLGRAKIADYFAKIDPLDKAGAYAAQGKAARSSPRIIGSRSNVIGLPLEKTSSALGLFEIRPRPTPNESRPAPPALPPRPALPRAAPAAARGKGTRR